MNDLEIGWLVVGRLETPDLHAVRQARGRVLRELREALPGFRWVMPLIEQPGVPTGARIEPSELLELGVAERDGRRWDFVLVIANADLIPHDKDVSLATPSRSLGVAAISTARIDPQAEGRDLDDRQRRDVMGQRLYALALHSLGHLNGLRHDDEPGRAMQEVCSLGDLDSVHELGPEQLGRLEAALREVADLRLEEDRTRRSHLRFAAIAAWRNARVLADAVLRARPWQFPLRLSKLTTAAMSTLVVLMVTAEVWDLALTLSGTFLLVMSGLIWLGTTWYVVQRQRLLLAHRAQRVTEQSVLGELTVALVVALGMLTTYAGLFALATLVGRLLFADRLIDSWAPVAGHRTELDYLRVSGFVAAVGILIGALGASFEQRHYLRHVTYVDEET